MIKKYETSIIMGMYNSSKTIIECLDSLMTQTYQNFNVIICDDGSSDDSYDIVSEYIKLYPDRFILLANQKNKGLNYTLNKCLEKASGTYIARMDADDINIENRLEIQINEIKSNDKIAIVSSNMIFFDEKGDYGVTRLVEYPTKKTFIKETAIFAHAAALIKREALVSVNGYTIDKNLLRVEDYNLWTKMYAKGYIGKNIQRPLYKMRNDSNAFGRRKFRYRINEFHAKNIAVKLLELPKTAYIYSLVPLIKGFIPMFVYKYIYKKKHNKV